MKNTTIDHSRQDAGEADKDIKSVSKSETAYERADEKGHEFQIAKAVVSVIAGRARSARSSVVENGTGEAKHADGRMSVYDYFDSIGK